MPDQGPGVRHTSWHNTEALAWGHRRVCSARPGVTEHPTSCRHVFRQRPEQPCPKCEEAEGRASGSIPDPLNDGPGQLLQETRRLLKTFSGSSCMRLHSKTAFSFDNAVGAHETPVNHLTVPLTDMMQRDQTQYRSHARYFITYRSHLLHRISTSGV